MQSSSPGLECGPLGVPGASARIQWRCGKVPALPNTSSHPLPIFQANLQGCLELLKSSKATFTVLALLSLSVCLSLSLDQHCWCW